MSADATTTRLTRLASTLRLEDLPELARTAAKARILSALAVALAAFEMEPVRIARKLAQPVASGPSATILGSLQTPNTAGHWMMMCLTRAGGRPFRNSRRSCASVSVRKRVRRSSSGYRVWNASRICGRLSG